MKLQNQKIEGEKWPKEVYGYSTQVHPDEQTENVIKPSMNRSQVLIDELRGITTIDLAFKSVNILEKIIWMIILLIGTLWACYFIQLQFLIWAEQPSIIIKSDNVKLSDLKYPAMTICSKAVFPTKTQK